MGPTGHGPPRSGRQRLNCSKFSFCPQSTRKVSSMARQTNGLHDPTRDPRPNNTHPSLQYDFEGLDAPSIKHSLANRLIYTVGKDSYTATQRDWLHAVAYMVRDRLTE